VRDPCRHRDIPTLGGHGRCLMIQTYTTPSLGGPLF
jgi:hypothetical protein